MYLYMVANPRNPVARPATLDILASLPWRLLLLAPRCLPCRGLAAEFAGGVLHAQKQTSDLETSEDKEVTKRRKRHPSRTTQKLEDYKITVLQEAQMGVAQRKKNTNTS